MGKRTVMKILPNFATTSEFGITILSNQYNGTSETKATTEKALNDGLLSNFNYFNTLVLDNQTDINTLEIEKQDKSDNNLNTSDKTVVGAINEHEVDIEGLNSNKQDKTDNNLNTTDKTVVGAINENFEQISGLSIELQEKTTTGSVNFTNGNLSAEKLNSRQYNVIFTDTGNGILLYKGVMSFNTGGSSHYLTEIYRNSSKVTGVISNSFLTIEIQTTGVSYVRENITII